MQPKIVLVGEAWGKDEEAAGKPFVGKAGGMLDAFLSACGISRQECFITNVFNFRPPDNKIPSLCGPKAEGIPGMPAAVKGKYVRAEFKGEIERLHREVKEVNPNLVVALGGTACWALLHDPRIKKLRGSPHRGLTGHKVFPTYHPAAVLREYKLRPIVFSDFKKIRGEAESREIIRPPREFWLYPTLADLEEFERRYIFPLPGDERYPPPKKLSEDIETWNRQITCIGFAPSPQVAIVIPFIWRGSPDGNYWSTPEAELTAWGFVKRWTEAGIPLIGQNFMYDMGYLWKRYGIRVNAVSNGSNLPPVNDTMLTHHAMQPEMEKSLALLSSLYTTEPQHKFMRAKNQTLKKED